MRWWGESLAGKANPDRQVVVPAPAGSRGSILVGPAVHHLALQYEIGRHQACTGREQSLQQSGGDPVRRAGDDPERPVRQPEITSIGTNHRHRRIREPPTQSVGTTRVELYGDHLGSGPNQRRGQRTETGTDVENELTGSDPGGVHDALGPTTIERMPSPGTPRLPGAGHGEPSRSS